MNINDYRRVMDRLVPDAALKERIMNQKNIKKKYTPARRVLTVALAAALTIACLLPNVKTKLQKIIKSF